MGTKKQGYHKQVKQVVAAAPIHHATDHSNLFSFDNIAFFNERNFKILSIVALFLMIGMSFDFGINGDEKFQVDYSKKLWNYYASFGKDTSALNVPEGKMHLYGGLFDIVAITLNKAMGLTNEFTPEYHYIRRVLGALFGFIILVFTSMLAKQIGGWPLGFLTFVLLLLSPRFLGDVMVNPKDIPFAAGYIMGLYFITRFIRELPKPTNMTMMGIIGGVLIALNSRAGGLLLLVYLFLFVSVFLTRNFYSKARFEKQDIISCIKYTLLVALLSYVAGILFWPYALSNPFLGPYKALVEFTKQPITFYVLFKGQHFISSKLPWNYLPEWIIRTIPIFSIFGALFFLHFSLKRYKALPFMETVVIVFSIIFPVVYAIYKQSPLHDGWRHFIFIYPSLVIVASFGWLLWFNSIRLKALKMVSIILLVCLLSENVFALISLHPYSYAYFNPLFGGLKRAYGNFETDYWMLSIQEAADWLKKHDHLGADNNSCTIVTNCIYPASIYLNDSSNRMEVKYVRYYEKSEMSWDYALFYSRFIDRSQLVNRSWPPKGTIHTIEADGIPICAIVKRENKEDYLGFEATKTNDVQQAIEHFTNALEYDPKNETVSLALAIIFLNIGQFEAAENAIQQSLKVYPVNPVALKVLESIRIKKQEASRATIPIQ